MQHHGSIGLGVFQNTVRNHFLRTAENLFCRLKHEFDRALQLILTGFENLGRTEQHGGVQIVSAGVHISVFRRKGQARFLTDGQCVHVCPEQKDLSGRFSFDLRYNSVFSAIDGPNAQFFKGIFDDLHRSGQFKARLRLFVQSAAVLYKRIREQLGFLQNFIPQRFSCGTILFLHPEPPLAPFQNRRRCFLSFLSANEELCLEYSVSSCSGTLSFGFWFLKIRVEREAEKQQAFTKPHPESGKRCGCRKRPRAGNRVPPKVKTFWGCFVPQCSPLLIFSAQ